MNIRHDSVGLIKTRTLIGGAIVSFWLVMIALLVYREVLLPSQYTAAPPVDALERPEDRWLGLFVGDDRVGHIHIHTTPETRAADPGVSVAIHAELSLPVAGMPAELEIGGDAWLSQASGLREFSFHLRSKEQTMRLEGAVEHQQLQATIEVAGEKLPLTLPVSENLQFSGGFGLPVTQMPVPEEGRPVYIDAFDPMSFTKRRAVIAKVGEETIAIGGQSRRAHLVTVTIADITTKAWLDQQGEVLRAETPFGFVIEQIAPEDAAAPTEPAESADLLQKLLVVPEGLSPWRGATRMKLRIAGVEEAVLPPEEHYQRWDGNQLVVTQTAPPNATEITPKLTSPEYLASDAFITANHEIIQRQAAEIVGDAKDPWSRAVRLGDWVYASIEKTSVISFPNSLEVLRTRSGDCNEHTVLYVALARAAEIPSRIAIGLVWSDELGGFAYHAWPEIQVGRWIPVDPTLGQTIADATHVKLFNGGIETWTRLLPYIGKMQIEVLEVQ